MLWDGVFPFKNPIEKCPWFPRGFPPWKKISMGKFPRRVYHFYNWDFRPWWALVNIPCFLSFYKFEEKREEKKEILHEIETKLSEENVPEAIQEGFKKVIANM